MSSWCLFNIPNFLPTTSYTIWIFPLNMVPIYIHKAMKQMDVNEWRKRTLISNPATMLQEFTEEHKALVKYWIQYPYWPVIYNIKIGYIKCIIMTVRVTLDQFMLCIIYRFQPLLSLWFCLIKDIYMLKFQQFIVSECSLHISFWEMAKNFIFTTICFLC